MFDAVEHEILERVKSPGWVTTRAIVLDPSDPPNQEENDHIEAVMKKLADEGKVVLWRLKIENDDTPLLAAARPDYQLDKELEARQAWATAERV